MNEITIKLRTEDVGGDRARMDLRRLGQLVAESITRARETDPGMSRVSVEIMQQESTLDANEVATAARNRIAQAALDAFDILREALGAACDELEHMATNPGSINPGDLLSPELRARIVAWRRMALP